MNSAIETIARVHPARGRDEGGTVASFSGV
jgi:hypothetical protein